MFSRRIVYFGSLLGKGVPLPVQACRHASSASSAASSGDVRFVPAGASNLNEIVEMCITKFVKIEPHSAALGMNRDAAPLFMMITGNALQYPYSYTVRGKNDVMIGFRLFSIGHRDSPLQPPKDLDFSRVPPTTLAFGEVLDELKKETFRRLPHVNKVLRRELTFILPEYQRKGIANRLAHYNLDFAQLQVEGVQGLVSEASSIANQTLLEKNHYKCIAEVPKSTYERLGITKLPDGTTVMKSYFRDISTLL